MMLLSVLKRGEPWDALAMSFDSEPSAFEKMIGNYLATVGYPLYQVFVTDIEYHWTMETLHEKGRLFEHFPSARYTTDVRFQEHNRLSGHIYESLPYYSGKHHLYGQKIKVSVLPNGLTIDFSSPCKNTGSDKEI